MSYVVEYTTARGRYYAFFTRLQDAYDFVHCNIWKWRNYAMGSYCDGLIEPLA